MGNSIWNGTACLRPATSKKPDDTRDHRQAEYTNYTTHPDTPDIWLDPKAQAQIKAVANLPGVTGVQAFPDLHPGLHGPVGCLVQAKRIYPHLVGSDIGCGFGFYKLGLKAGRVKLSRLADKLAQFDTLNFADIYAPPGFDDLPFAHALGSIGEGNHFCELQQLETLTPDAGLGSGLGSGLGAGLGPGLGPDLDEGYLHLLVHSGSRAFGGQVFDRFANNDGINAGSDLACDYLQQAGQASAWAAANRLAIAAKAAHLLGCDFECLVDVPHNLIVQRDASFWHFKGASCAQAPFIPLAGTRETPSFLLQSTGKAAALPHGAGRKHDRRRMHAKVPRVKSALARMQRPKSGNHVLCADRDLLIEEAVSAYKDAAQVVATVQAHGLAKPLARLHPLVTFKKGANKGTRHAKRDKKQRRTQEWQS